MFIERGCYLYGDFACERLHGVNPGFAKGSERSLPAYVNGRKADAVGPVKFKQIRRIASAAAK